MPPYVKSFPSLVYRRRIGKWDGAGDSSSGPSAVFSSESRVFGHEKGVFLECTLPNGKHKAKYDPAPAAARSRLRADFFVNMLKSSFHSPRACGKIPLY
jgi:hypothetical protein